MSRTRYKFKGYTITNCGYHQPDHCVWWEAVDENGEACFHGHSLREVEFMILDDEWEKKLREKDAEIERLKLSSVGNAAAMREALKGLNEEMTFCERNVELGIGFALEGLREHCRIVRQILNAALAVPLRNCDVGTAEEQAERFARYCDTEVCKRKRCKTRPKALVIDSCALRWAQEGGANA